MHPGQFRLLLAALVFVSHVSRFNTGRPAVAVFFVLSGYWVARLYEARTASSTLVYLQDRFLRIWPTLAVVAVGVVAGDALLGTGARGSLASTLLLLGLATRRTDVIGVAWSLDIELQFYLLLPVVAAVIRRQSIRWRPTALVVGIALATCAGLGLLRAGVVTVLAYAPAFAAGASIWYLRWRPTSRLAIVSLAVFAMAASATLLSPATRPMLIKSGELWWYDPLWVALCLLLTPFIAWNVHRPSSALDRGFGNISFAFYLVQYPVIVFVAELALPPGIGKLTALAATIAVTLIVYFVFDRRFESVRRHLSGRTAAAVARRTG